MSNGWDSATTTLFIMMKNKFFEPVYICEKHIIAKLRSAVLQTRHVSFRCNCSKSESGARCGAHAVHDALNAGHICSSLHFQGLITLRLRQQLQRHVLIPFIKLGTLVWATILITNINLLNLYYGQWRSMTYY